jgi:hypothetical protein
MLKGTRGKAERRKGGKAESRRAKGEERERPEEMNPENITLGGGLQNFGDQLRLQIKSLVVLHVRK